MFARFLEMFVIYWQSPFARKSNLTGQEGGSDMSLAELVLVLHEKIVALEKEQQSSNEDTKHNKPQG